MKHPYYLAPGDPREASIPMLEVVYRNGSKSTPPILALIDSGASVSFAPLDLAMWLGVKVDTKHRMDIRGFNNAITVCYPGNVTIDIHEGLFDIPIYFGGKANTLCILGQDPFFDKAQIVFERYNDLFSVNIVSPRLHR